MTKVWLIILIIGAITFAVGMILMYSLGIDRFIKTESFEIKNQSVDNVKEIDIKVEYADLEIVKGGEKLYVKAENIPADTYEHGIDDDTFYFKTTNRVRIIGPDLATLWTKDKYHSKIFIEIPEKLFDDISIDIGAGELKIDGLEAKDIDFDIGAGDSTVKNISSTNKLDIDLGAGNSSFENCDTNKVNIDSGVGEMSFSGTVSGGLDADCGVGQVNLTIVGSYHDYDIETDVGIGEVNIDKNSSGGGHGDIPIKIEGGIGEINLKFVDKL